MGYSCTAKAAYVRDAINAIVDREEPGECTNRVFGGGFFETGGERADGAIVGTVWRKLNAAERAQWAHLDDLDSRVSKAGSFHISPDGKIKRFPGFPRKFWAEAEAKAAAAYAERHEPERDLRPAFCAP